MKFLILFLLVSVTAPAQADVPDWAKKQGRSVEGGHILQVGTGTSDSEDVAVFKAQQAAIKSLRIECGGWAHKDIAPEKIYSEKRDKEYVAYARAAIRFSACEQGKSKDATLENTDNPQLRKAQDLYDLLVAMDSKGEKYPEFYGRIMSFQTELQMLYMKVEADQKEYQKEMDRKYAEHLAEVKADHDSLAEELGAQRLEIEDMKRGKARTARLKEESAERAKFSPAKKKCFAEMKRMNDQITMDNGGNPMNEALDPIVEKQAECAAMQ